jgi:hypothetical protein
VREQVQRRVETLVGDGTAQRAYFYCVCCGHGFYPLDVTIELAAGCIQFDVQQAAAKLVAEVSYETAHVLFRELNDLGETWS